MRRIGVTLAVVVGVAAVLLVGASYLLPKAFQPLPGSRAPAISAEDAQKMSDEELVRAIAAGDAGWTVAELRTRCHAWSAPQLDTLVNLIVDTAFPLQEGLFVLNGCQSFLTAVEGFLPPPQAQRAVKRAYEKRRQVFQDLNTYTQSQASSAGSHTSEDAEKLYQICADLQDENKYPQLTAGGCLGSEREMIRGQALSGLTYCGPAGLASIRKLGESGPPLAQVLARTGRPEDILELLDLCRTPPTAQNRLAYLSALSSLRPERRTAETRDVLQKYLPPYFQDPKPETRGAAAYTAGHAEDVAFLPALKELAANDPYHKTDTRSYNSAVRVEQTFERYTVRENADQAIEMIEMADAQLRAVREAAAARVRNINEIRDLETSIIGIRCDAMYAMYERQRGKQDGDPLNVASWNERLERLTGMRMDALQKMARLRKDRADLLNEPHLKWQNTEPDLLGLMAARLAAAAELIFPDRIKGPLAEYRRARDGDDLAKRTFAAKVRAGMSTGWLMVTLLHQLHLQHNPFDPANAALTESYKDAALSHGQEALFMAPSFLLPPNRPNEISPDFVPDDVAEDQKARLLEYRNLKEKVRQIDYILGDAGEREWLIAAIRQQRTEARQRMDQLWRELKATV